MNRPQTFEHVSRDQLLLWVREHCPDLRIGHTRDKASGERATHAWFTWPATGEVFVLDTQDDIAIARACFAQVRALLGMPVDQSSRDVRGVTLESEIVQARAAGDPEMAKQLQAELVALRTGGAVPHKFRVGARRERTPITP